MFSKRCGFWACSAVCLLLIGCNQDAANNKTRVTVTGAGATLPAPLYEKWFTEYGAGTGTRIVYQAVGSSRGVQSILTDTVDFGASDTPLSADQQSQAGDDVLQIPTTLSAVAIVYHMPEVENLKLTGEVLAGIVSGAITTWNDPRIAQLNSGEELPAGKLAFVRRTDGSGTTTLLTEYLSATSPSFKEKYGVGAKIKTAGALEADGNAGATMLISQTRGSLGYVALNYARANKLQTARMFNSTGAYVEPSLDSITAAASLTQKDLTVSLINSRAPGAYPIASFSYLLVHQDAAEPCETRRALSRFIWWTLRDGQSFAPFLHYGALPPLVVKHAEEQLRKLTCQGKALL